MVGYVAASYVAQSVCSLTGAEHTLMANAQAIVIGLCFANGLSPVTGVYGWLAGVLFGMMRLNFWTYLSASWLSIAPGMVCLCILGNNLDFKSPVFWAMLALNLVLLLGSLWYTRHKLGQSSKRT